MAERLRRATTLPWTGQIWDNPDCGLKTRGWPKTTQALEAMIAAGRILHAETAQAAQADTAAG